jgi:hypothetical protein
MLIMEKLVKGEWQIQRSARSDAVFTPTIHDRSTGTRRNYLFETTPTSTSIYLLGPGAQDSVIPDTTNRLVAYRTKTLLRELKQGQSHEMTLLTDYTDRRAQYRFRHEDE